MKFIWFIIYSRALVIFDSVCNKIKITWHWWHSLSRLFNNGISLAWMKGIRLKAKSKAMKWRNKKCQKSTWYPLSHVKVNKMPSAFHWLWYNVWMDGWIRMDEQTNFMFTDYLVHVDCHRIIIYWCRQNMMITLVLCGCRVLHQVNLVFFFV